MFKDKNGNRLTYSQAYPKIINRIHHIWLDFILFILTLVGYIPFHSIRLFFYTIAGMHIEKHSRIHMWARFYEPKNIRIGEGTIIGDHVFLDGRAVLTIGSHTSIASEVLIYNSEHDIEDENFTAREENVTIGDYVFIGPRAIILPGVEVGDGAVVAAGAVVTKRVEPYTVVGGVPAKIIGERKRKELHYRLGRARLFQ